MSGNVKITLDHSGVAEVLNSSEAAALVGGMAAKIAASVRAAVPVGTDVKVDSYKTDRAAASVTIRDAMGKTYQARDGVLTRAAAANGAEVKARSR